MVLFMWISIPISLIVALAFGFWFYKKRILTRRFVAHYYPGRVSTARRYKLLLIVPTLIRNDGQPVKQPLLMLPGITGAVLAALTPDDWEMEIVFETIEEVPFDSDADLIAISAMGVGLWRGLDMARQFKARGKKVVVGGLMATLMPEYTLAHGADAVCLGDAEGVWERILRDFEQDRLQGMYDGRQSASLNWPVPRYDLIAKKRIGPVLPVMAGRGCPHRCEFCSLAAYYQGKYYRRPIEEVIRDIRAVKQLGFKRVLILDDNIAADPDHAVKLFKEVEKLDVQWVSQCAIYIAAHADMLQAAVRSGCTTLSFGLETVNQESLNAVQKTFARVSDYEQYLETIRRAGIDVATEMVLGIDGDDPATFKRTADYIIRNRITLPKFYILTPVPGTPLYDRFDREGRIIDKNYIRYNASQAVFRPARMSPAELEQGYWRLYDRVFTIPAIFKRVFGAPIKLSLFSRLVILFVNLHYRRYIRRRIAPGML